MQQCGLVQQAQALSNKGSLRSTHAPASQQPKQGAPCVCGACGAAAALHLHTSRLPQGHWLAVLVPFSGPNQSDAASAFLPAVRSGRRGGVVAARAERAAGESLTPLEVLRKENELLKQTITTAEGAGRCRSAAGLRVAARRRFFMLVGSMCARTVVLGVV